MSIESVLQRVAALERALANPAALLAARNGGVAAPAATAPVKAGTTPVATAASPSFAATLQSASASYPASALSSGVGMLTPVAGLMGPAAGVGIGGRIVAAAESQLGQAEQPPGSNESPAIAEYRGATAGAIPGAPWCAYFASWAARQAGAPLGPQGEGLGSVGQIWTWAQSTGRAIPNGPGVVPQPGELIVFGDQHVGIVKEVLPNGNIQTLEGNYENKVSLNTRTPTEATGYVTIG
jgi:hypothetical protein